jgi:hypothetical protein
MPRDAEALAAVSLAKANLRGDENIQTSIGDIELAHNYFDDDDASECLFDEMDYQRATQAYIWSTPLVSITTWRDSQGPADGVTKETDFVVLESLREKRGIVTGNLTTPYIFNFISLTSGPLQIEYPAGKGATYILVGPEDEVTRHAKAGAHVFQAATNNIFIGLRILDKDPGYFDKFSTAFKMGRVGQASR